MFIDSHAHLDSPKFAADRQAVLQRAHAAGLTHILAIGNGDGPATMDCALDLAASTDAQRAAPDNALLPKVLASAGVHPHDARLLDGAARQLMRALAADPRILAWGEIGFDYHYDYSPRDVQQSALIEQMQLAAEHDLPLILHCRPSDGATDAFDDLFRLLREHWNGRRGIFHCFTGGLPQARTALELGFNLSFSGNISFPKMNHLREAAAFVPGDRFFIETDCPYLAPVPHRGKRNEPAFVTDTARHIAQLRAVSAAAIGEQTSANFLQFFRQYPRSASI